MAYSANGVLGDDVGLQFIPLIGLLMTRIGPAFVTWDYTALRAELEESYGAIGVQTWQKIMAATVLLSSEVAWQEWEVFENMVAAIVGEMPIFSYVQPPEPAEMVIALSVMGRVANYGISSEVADYITAACLNDGLWYLEEGPLSIARMSLMLYDKRLGIQRDFSSVSDAIAMQSSMYSPAESPEEVQANKVRETRLVLKRYIDTEKRQVQELSGVLQGSK